MLQYIQKNKKVAYSSHLRKFIVTRFKLTNDLWFFGIVDGEGSNRKVKGFYKAGAKHDYFKWYKKA